MRGHFYLESEDYEQRTGGWKFNNWLMQAITQRFAPVQRLVLPAGFPRPSARALADTESILAGLPAGSVMFADQICIAPGAFERTPSLRLVNIFHHPIGKEVGQIDREALIAREREGLRRSSLIVVTSEATAAHLVEDAKIDPSQIVVAHPGLDRVHAIRPERGATLRLVNVGALVPRKDHLRLVRLCARSALRDWSLSLCGNTTRYPGHVDAVRREIAALRIEQNVAIVGEIEDDALERLWDECDVGVFASSYEGYGLAVAEAIARGVPVVSTRAGGALDWARAGAHIVHDGDDDGFVTALKLLEDDPAALRQAQRRANDMLLPDWQTAADLVWARLQRLG